MVLLAVGLTVLAFGFLFLALGLPFAWVPSPLAVLATLAAGAAVVFAGLAYGMRYSQAPPIANRLPPRPTESSRPSSPVVAWTGAPAPPSRRFTVRGPALEAALPSANRPDLPGSSASRAIDGPGEDGSGAFSRPGPPGSAGPSLSFSPALQGAGPVRPTGAEASHAAYLRREVDQLRARLRDLEGVSRRSGGVAGLPPPIAGAAARPVAEPPPMREAPVRSASCASCGRGLSEAPHPSLCWGCSRPMCSDCYWRTGSGSNAHRCTTCVARGRSAESPRTPVGEAILTPSLSVSPSIGDGAPPTPGR